MQLGPPQAYLDNGGSRLRQSRRQARVTSLGTGRMAVAELGWHVGGVGAASVVYMSELRK